MIHEAGMFHVVQSLQYLCIATMKLRCCFVVLCTCVLTVCSKGEAWITFMTRLLNTGVHMMYNAVHGCTRGFMELELLKRRAEKIPGGGEGTGGGLDNEFRLVLNESFSCSGNMTGLLLVGAVRTNMGGRTQYPDIQIWRNTGSNTYTRNGSEHIKLNEGDFSSDGVLQYNLTTPISYQSGDVLGVYQPDQSDSIVRVYYDSNTSTTYQMSGNNPTSINVQNELSSSNELILISPISGI